MDMISGIDAAQHKYINWMDIYKALPYGPVNCTRLQQFMKEMVKNILVYEKFRWNSNKLKSRGFLASGLSTYDFSTLYTTLPHNLIKEKLTELIEQTFNREGSLYLACNDKNAFFTSENLNDINCDHVWKCVMRSIIFWIIYLLDLARNCIDKL